MHSVRLREWSDRRCAECCAEVLGNGAVLFWRGHRVVEGTATLLRRADAAATERGPVDSARRGRRRAVWCVRRAWRPRSRRICCNKSSRPGSSQVARPAARGHRSVGPRGSVPSRRQRSVPACPVPDGVAEALRWELSVLQDVPREALYLHRCVAACECRQHGLPCPCAQLFRASTAAGPRTTTCQTLTVCAHIQVTDSRITCASIGDSEVLLVSEAPRDEPRAAGAPACAAAVSSSNPPMQNPAAKRLCVESPGGRPSQGLRQTAAAPAPVATRLTSWMLSKTDTPTTNEACEDFQRIKRIAEVRPRRKCRTVRTAVWYFEAVQFLG